MKEQEEEQKFEIGDVVCLSSNPEVKMTVTGYVDYNICNCIWFDKNNVINSYDIDQKALDLFESLDT
jgi:uncharacterized protein YodC (DUF2158 family)